MSNRKWDESQPAVHESTGAKGGKATLRSEEQQPAGVEPDSDVDEKLTRSKRKPPAGLDPNSIVRN